MRTFLLLGAINGFISVALGAFGAHGLEGKISAHFLEVWEKGVNYQMFHAATLLFVGIIYDKVQKSSISISGWLFFLGILLFSGSLYLYSTTGITMIAMITPFGGIMFLLGWIFLSISIIRSK